MTKKTFSIEEILKLQANPYVKNVSASAITYTQEFREYFISEYEKGKAPSEILVNAGFDRRVLGKERCDNISRRFRKMAKREAGLVDTRKAKSGRPLTRNLSPEEKVQRLEQKIKYLEQENSFLKKINFLDKKARFAHERKKSSKSSMK